MTTFHGDEPDEGPSLGRAAQPRSTKMVVAAEPSSPRIVRSRSTMMDAMAGTSATRAAALPVFGDGRGVGTLIEPDPWILGVQARDPLLPPLLLPLLLPLDLNPGRVPQRRRHSAKRCWGAGRAGASTTGPPKRWRRCGVPRPASSKNGEGVALLPWRERAQET